GCTFATDGRRPHYLVFMGGGIKGISHCGVLIVLEHLGCLRRVRVMGGASIGALVAALYALGYSACELADLTCETDFAAMLRELEPTALLFGGGKGMARGNWLRGWITSLMERRGFAPDVTLAELRRRTDRTLQFTTVCVEDRALVRLSHASFPDLPLLTALMMSMAMPFVFEPVCYNGKTYVDGGLIDNYPVSPFPADQTLGIRLGPVGTPFFPVPRNPVPSSPPVPPPSSRPPVPNTAAPPPPLIQKTDDVAVPSSASGSMPQNKPTVPPSPPRRSLAECADSLRQGFAGLAAHACALYECMYAELERTRVQQSVWEIAVDVGDAHSLAFGMDRADRARLIKSGIAAALRFVAHPTRAQPHQPALVLEHPHEISRPS
ncbi:Patatin phospholipase, partial [uncultured virus]